MNNSTSTDKFWIAFWATIIVLAIIYFSAVYEASKEDSKVKVTDNGTVVVISDEIAKAWKIIAPSIIVNIDDFINKTKSETDALIDEKIDAVFSPVYGQIPKFADFHYSVTGEYMEIVAALSQDMGNRVQDILFNQVGFEGNLQSAFNKINEQSNEKISGAMGRINSDIQSKIGLGNNDMNLLTKTLHLTIQDVKNRFSSLTYSTIRGTAGIGLTTTGAVLAKIMGQKLAVKVAAKTAVKTSVKEVGILSGAGSGAAVCAVGGPLAMVACGLVGGIVAWVTVDKLIVEIDEHYNRKEFEQELRSMVDQQKQEIKQGLIKAYTTALTTIADEQKNKIKSGVRPIDLLSN